VTDPNLARGGGLPRKFRGFAARKDLSMSQSKTVTIIVNGRTKQVEDKRLSYEEVVNLAFDNNPPHGENIVITVTYSKGDHPPQGTLSSGETVNVKEGMIFNVTATDKS